MKQYICDHANDPRCPGKKKGHYCALSVPHSEQSGSGVCSDCFHDTTEVLVVKDAEYIPEPQQYLCECGEKLVVKEVRPGRHVFEKHRCRLGSYSNARHHWE